MNTSNVKTDSLIYRRPSSLQSKVCRAANDTVVLRFLNCDSTHFQVLHISERVNTVTFELYKKA